MNFSADQIAKEINAAGDRYYDEKARGWDGSNIRRIYFGRDFVTIAEDGEVHGRKAGKARAQTIGWEAVEMVEAAITRLVEQSQEAESQQAETPEAPKAETAEKYQSFGRVEDMERTESSPARPVDITFLPCRWVVSCPDAWGDQAQSFDLYREACDVARPLADQGHRVSVRQVV